MKKIRLIQFVLFLIICIFVVTKLSWLFRSNDSLGRAYMSGFRSERDLDVVYIGASTVVDFYEPMAAYGEYGFTSYNYAGVGFRGDIIPEYIEDIKNRQEPKVYVIDMCTFPGDNSNVDESGLRNWSDSMPVLSLTRIKGITHYLKARNWNVEDPVSYYIDLIKYHTNHNALGNDYNWNAAFHPKKYGSSYNGFEPLFGHVAYDKPEAPVENRSDLSEYSLTELDRLLDCCDELNAEVLFVMFPHVRQPDGWGYSNSIGDVIAERGYTFIDLNRYYDEMGLDFETDYANHGHLNFYGAEKYTHFMGGYLAANYNLPDHRNESDNPWNERYLSYRDAQSAWSGMLAEVVDKDLADKKMSEGLKETDEFEKWFYEIQNSGLLVFVSMSDEDYNGADHHIKCWGLDTTSGDKYTGIFRGDECLYSSNNGQRFEGEVGRANEELNCVVDAADGNHIVIDNTEYVNNESGGIDIVIYNECYNEFVDHVILSIDESGKIHMSR